MQEDIVFAKIVLHNKLLSKTQLDTCIKEVEKAASAGKPVPLSEIVLSKELLTRKQAYAVAWAVQHTMMKSQDRIYAKALLDKKLITEADIEKVFSLQTKTFNTQRQSVSIHDILVSKGILSRKVAAEVMCEIEQPVSVKATEESSFENEPVVKKAGHCKVTMQAVSLPSGRKVCRMDLQGSLDANSFDELQNIIEDVLVKGGDSGKYIVLNLRGLRYMSSAGVGVLLSVNRAAQEEGGACEIADASKDVKEILELVGLGAVLKFYTMQEALDAIAKA